ncbi:MAG: hypothetical protein NC390_02510 [Fusobacterium sp.]|nr:hypothetical protein [Fusobacterium sp.]
MKKLNAFTMAEILLSLTIIGVVAAITLPSLTGNINERTWNTQRKALYARFSQAISLMPALNGYGKLEEGDPNNVTETFITNGLSKVLKINNICDSEHIADCGITSKFANYATNSATFPVTLHELCSGFSRTGGYNEGDAFSTKNTKVAAFETQNGESIITYYNPSCITEYRDNEKPRSDGLIYGFPIKRMCANFIYDLNGTKGPNTFGKDIGVITVLNATDSITVAPIPIGKDVDFKKEAGGEWYTVSQASSYCKQMDADSRLPNIDELNSMDINQNIIGLPNDKYYMAGTRQVGNYYYAMYFRNHLQYAFNNGWASARCIKR